ncbi:MAG TPA: HIT domain-containing protein [Candidatus Kryptonia bacterium]
MQIDNCAFCKIVRGESYAQFLYESAESVAFLDINPINFGHALVVTKDHYRTFLDLPLPVLTDVVESLRVVSRAITETLQAAGLNIFSNNGSAAGQSVFHFHFHVTPRYEDDGLKIRPHLKMYESLSQMTDYAERIRATIQVYDKPGVRS